MNSHYCTIPLAEHLSIA